MTRQYRYTEHDNIIYLAARTSAIMSVHRSIDFPINRSSRESNGHAIDNRRFNKCPHKRGIRVSIYTENLEFSNTLEEHNIIFERLRFFVPTIYYLGMILWQYKLLFFNLKLF